MRVWIVWALVWATVVIRVAATAVRARVVAQRSAAQFRRFQDAFAQATPTGSASPGLQPESTDWGSPFGRQFRSVRVLGGAAGSEGRAA
jgi:hypothetical protein